MTSHLAGKRKFCKINIRRAARVSEYAGRANFCSNLLSCTNGLQISITIFRPIFDIIKPLHCQFCAISSQSTICLMSTYILCPVLCKIQKIYLEDETMLYPTLTLCAAGEFEFVNPIFEQKGCAVRFLQLISCSRSLPARKTASLKASSAQRWFFHNQVSILIRNEHSLVFGCQEYLLVFFCCKKCKVKVVSIMS